MGLHWRPWRQSTLEDKPGREGKEVGKGQNVGLKEDSQRMREDSKGRRKAKNCIKLPFRVCRMEEYQRLGLSKMS